MTSGPGGARRRRQAGLLAGLVALLLLLLAGLSLGSRPVPPGESLAAFWAFDPSNDLHLIVRGLRLPRTLLAMLAGAALGVAGALMQAVTRNPLAEPGLLGINAGAAVAVLIGVAAFGLTRIEHYVWFGFAGAGLAGIAVFVLGRAQESGTDPVRLVLAGAGLSVVLGALTGLILLNAPAEVFESFRQWGAGSVEGRGFGVLAVLGLALLAGGGIAQVLAPGLNALALGRDLGLSLGARPELSWALACLAILLLAGAATAAAGPIGLIGLVAPHLARLVAGPDYRWIVPFSALFAAALLLLADVLGRLIAPPVEVAAGIVAAILGGPFFIAAVRRFRLARP